MNGNPFIDRRALFTSAAAATLLAASGVSAAGLPQRGGRLRMALSGAARADTWGSGNGLFMQVARQGLVFDTLTEVAADGSLHAELATDWSVSDDARVWEFSLRTDVTFHDGTSLTAVDVVQSLVHLRAAEVAAIDTHRVRITLGLANADLPLQLSHPDFVIRPAHALTAGIGTGLYRVKHFAPGQQLLTTRVDAHYKDGNAGWFEEVELVSIPSESVRAEALGGYMVDAADVTDPAVVAGLPNVTVLPNANRILQAVSNDLAQPTRIGAERPMDNLRAAERWWIAR